MKNNEAIKTLVGHEANNFLRLCKGQYNTTNKLWKNEKFEVVEKYIHCFSKVGNIKTFQYSITCRPLKSDSVLKIITVKTREQKDVWTTEDKKEFKSRLWAKMKELEII